MKGSIKKTARLHASFCGIKRELIIQQKENIWAKVGPIQIPRVHGGQNETERLFINGGDLQKKKLYLVGVGARQEKKIHLTKGEISLKRT